MAVPTINPTRQDTWRVKLWVDDLRPNSPGGEGGARVDTGVWDKKSGGSLDSEERIYHPGGMRPAISLGGRLTPEAVTLSRIYSLNFQPWLLDILLTGAGKATCLIAQRAMDIQGRDSSSYVQYHGTLKTVTPPEHDSEGSDPAMLEVVISVANAPVMVT